ncbi:CPBP family intramembrane metalloprotease [Deinococcus detaillensis]|uniref:CPBP family intramembrane metalloprotease n=1 Tax=Deinococcus detaillensis TaxID=2592048 RepID=A0A553UI93_9DEIO|nr:CPBP family intramembrane glutamic endopeptidase [Deinococcus detaillensis]TSA79944.1 CPBP family intramembrane metalloprotease [Deinococcus detaillensis]
MTSLPLQVHRAFLQSPSRYFGWVFAASLPFYALGILAPQLKRLIPFGLPISTLMILCPAGVAISLTYRHEGQAGVRRLLGRVFDDRVIPNKTWLLLSVGIMPAAMLLSYAVQRLLDPSLPQAVWSLTLVFSFAVYFFGAISEELGWTGYALDPLQHRYGCLMASVGLGMLWWLWHVIPYHVTGRSTDWILWQGLATVMFRIIMVWIYNHAGRSVLTSILFHAAINTSIDAFPVSGSHYDPKVMGLMLLGLTLLVAVGPKFLTMVASPKRVDPR